MRSSNHRAIQAIQGHRASRPSPRFSFLRWAGCHTSARAVRSQLVVCGCRVVGPERCAHRPAPSELHYRILRKSKRAFDGGMGLQCCSSKSKFLYGVEPDSFWALKLARTSSIAVVLSVYTTLSRANHPAMRCALSLWRCRSRRLQESARRRLCLRISVV